MRAKDLLIGIGPLIFGVGQVVLRILRELLASVADDEEQGDRQIHDSDFIGEYNYRTNRLDAGTDPYGWYDED